RRATEREVRRAGEPAGLISRRRSGGERRGARSSFSARDRSGSCRRVGSFGFHALWLPRVQLREKRLRTGVGEAEGGGRSYSGRVVFDGGDASTGGRQKVGSISEGDVDGTIRQNRF